MELSRKIRDGFPAFCAYNHLKDITDEINKIPELEREGYIKSVHAIKSWADTMEFNINNKTKEIN